MPQSVIDLRSQFKDPGPAELELIARYAMLPVDARRERAFEVFSKTGLPHRRLEDWKWTDFRASLGAIESPEKVQRTPLLLGSVPTVKISQSGVDFPKETPEGITLHPRTEPQALGRAEDAPLGALTAALSGHVGGLDTLIVEVTGASTQLHIICDGGGGEANFGRVMVFVRPGASIDLFESHIGGAGLSCFLIEVGVEAGGTVNRTVLQEGGRDENQAVTSLVTLDKATSYAQTQLSLGAKLSRLETHLVHQETGAQAVLNAAYLCSDGLHSDITTRVRHGAISCTTKQVTKGAVLNGGTGVFQGKFHVPKTVGQFTDADMQHQALLLEEGAVVFAKPELEIYADDVECAHGNTSGALDDDQLFYLRQRGIPLQQARAILTEAFIAEALEHAPEQAQEQLLDHARNFLAGWQA